MTMLDPGAEDLPPIPSKRYFTIGEVGTLCCVKPHVLRYWEQEFPQLQPVKRRGNSILIFFLQEFFPLFLKFLGSTISELTLVKILNSSETLAS